MHFSHTSQSWLYELALWYVVNHSIVTWRGLIAHFNSAEQALAASAGDWKVLSVHASHLKRLSDWKVNGAIRQQYHQTIRAIEQGDFHLLYEKMPEYPKLLATITDPPPFLFYQGNIGCLNQPQLALVGTRKPSPSARKIAFDFARELAQSGIWITSGLAHGVDADCHRGALAAGGGRTIAVLGTGIDLCYPSAHQSLFNQIVAEGGLILSEFTPKTEPLAHHFPRRNRIVSGLSLGVLVVEAALKSGSLITARLAAEQGRDVLVIPGHIANEQAAGCHQLIRDGARLVTSVADILEDLNLSRNPLLSSSLESAVAQPVEPAQPLDAHLQPLMAHLDWQGQSIDSLVDSSGIDVATLSGFLMELELMGQVVQVNGLYQRCRV
ncbi:DNA-protecting protein DprA [Aquirhabdus parva]|uniref:DNA-protecting protein DprA n=1 Tax=Aquirhabdus parva TaxID=2283318 RepID=A0A345P825_9GAMM|nr:DNA-protecting protein DprA [Aquirhabdus parva]